jgi:GNAT superfamily N-acetyltransferase
VSFAVTAHYTIRRAERQDMDILVAFTLAEGRDAEGLGLDPTEVERGVRAAFAEPSLATYWVAEAPDGRVVAHTSVVTEWSDFRGRHYWWVQSLFVEPEHRGRGVTAQLLDHLAREAGRADAVDLRLHVHTANERARRAYERCGFVLAPFIVMTRPAARD